VSKCCWGYVCSFSPFDSLVRVPAAGVSPGEAMADGTRQPPRIIGVGVVEPGAALAYLSSVMQDCSTSRRGTLNVQPSFTSAST